MLYKNLQYKKHKNVLYKNRKINQWKRKFAKGLFLSVDSWWCMKTAFANAQKLWFVDLYFAFKFNIFFV